MGMHFARRRSGRTRRGRRSVGQRPAAGRRTSMWAQTLSGPFRFEQLEVEAPDPAALPPRHVLLAPRAGAICGSDLPNFRGGVWPHPAAEDGWGATRAPGFPMHDVVGWASMFDALAGLVVTDGEGLAPYDASLPPTTAVMLQPLACVLYAVE